MLKVLDEREGPSPRPWMKSLRAVATLVGCSSRSRLLELDICVYVWVYV